MIYGSDVLSSLVSAGLSVASAVDTTTQEGKTRSYLTSEVGRARTDLTQMEQAASSVSAVYERQKASYKKSQNAAAYVALGAGALLLIYGAMQ